jgi:hypothetical protein
MPIYQLPYDEKLDNDIHKWLSELPRNRKAEMVRNAIRFYIQSTKSGNVYTVNPSESYTVDTKENYNSSSKPKKKKPNLPTDGNF